jgi:predicted transcriptional regulator
MPIRTIKDIPSAAWWPEFLTVKDSMTWAALAEKFGVSAISLRKALMATGYLKVPLPRGRKPRAAETAAAPSSLASFRSMLGKVADEVIAAKAGVSRAVVGAWRRKLGIDAYDGFRFGRRRRNLAEAARAVHVAAARKPPVAETAPVPATAASEVAAATTSSPRKRRSAIDAYADMLGKATDAKIAALAGVTPAAVTQYRQKRGIARFEKEKASRSVDRGVAELVESDHAPAPVVASPASTHAPVSPIDAYRDELGKVADHAIAAKAGVTLSAVGHYRRKAGIPAYDGFRFEKKRPRIARVEDRPTPAASVYTAGGHAPVPAAPPATDPAMTTAPSPRRYGPRSAIEAHASKLGKVPDAEIAAMAGISPDAVKMYRKRHGIARFGASKASVTGPQPDVEAGLEALPATPSGLDDGNATIGPVFELPPEFGLPVPVVADALPLSVPPSDLATAAPRAWALRSSRIDAYAELVGKDPDAKVARIAGVTREAVRQYRLKRGIPNRRATMEAVAPIASIEVAAIVPAPLGELPSPRTSRTAFTVLAQAGSRSERFMLVATDLADAAQTCLAAISRWTDGPWQITAIEKFAEALE